MFANMAQRPLLQCPQGATAAQKFVFKAQVEELAERLLAVRVSIPDNILRIAYRTRSGYVVEASYAEDGSHIKSDYFIRWDGVSLCGIDY